jgi:hypothetical protein
VIRKLQVPIKKEITIKSGILIQIRAFCSSFRHLVKDSGILIHVQALCYRFRHSATWSCNLMQGHAICCWVMETVTGSEICYVEVLSKEHQSQTIIHIICSYDLWEDSPIRNELGETLGNSYRRGTI